MANIAHNSTSGRQEPIGNIIIHILLNWHKFDLIAEAFTQELKQQDGCILSHSLILSQSHLIDLSNNLPLAISTSSTSTCYSSLSATFLHSTYQCRTLVWVNLHPQAEFKNLLVDFSHRVDESSQASEFLHRKLELSWSINQWLVLDFDRCLRLSKLLNLFSIESVR